LYTQAGGGISPLPPLIHQEDGGLGRAIVLCFLEALATVSALIARRLVDARLPFNPTFDITGISDPTPGVPASVSTQTTLQASNHILGTFGLLLPSGWDVAADPQIPDGNDGSPDSFGPSALTP